MMDSSFERLVSSGGLFFFKYIAFTEIISLQYLLASILCEFLNNMCKPSAYLGVLFIAFFGRM